MVESFEQFSFIWKSLAAHSSLQYSKKIFKRIYVGWLSRPIKYFNPIVCYPLLHQLRCVFRVIVMLKYPSKRHLFFCKGHHDILKDSLVPKTVHHTFYLMERTSSETRKTRPHHYRTYPMLHCNFTMTWIQPFSFPASYSTHAVKIKQIKFGFVAKKYSSPLINGPI